MNKTTKAETIAKLSKEIGTQISDYRTYKGEEFITISLNAFFYAFDFEGTREGNFEVMSRILYNLAAYGWKNNGIEPIYDREYVDSLLLTARRTIDKKRNGGPIYN